jgi:hypothetical protein
MFGKSFQLLFMHVVASSVEKSAIVKDCLLLPSITINLDKAQTVVVAVNVAHVYTIYITYVDDT